MLQTLLLLCGLLSQIQAPARPDFSGTWVLDPSKTTSTGAPMRVGGPGGLTGPLPVGTVTEPRRIKNVAPRYPVEAQRDRISGTVILEAIIDRQGKVKDLRVLRSVRELDRAAMEAVSQWEYTPSFFAGVPVEVVMTVTVTFTLTGASPQMGVPAGAARGGGGRGGGRGPTPTEIAITQKGDGLTLVRGTGDTRSDIRYRFDGRPVSSKIFGAGGAVDNTYVYVSRWEGEKLVSQITWVGPQGPRDRTETIWIEGDVLKIQTLRAATDPGAEPFVTTNAFNRKR